MLRAGDLRHRITIQRPHYTQDTDTGAMVLSWNNFLTVWAAIKPLSAREFISAQAEQSKVSARIVIRARDGITADMRIVHGSKFYNIEGVLSDMESGLEYITLPVSEGVVADGEPQADFDSDDFDSDDFQTGTE